MKKTTKSILGLVPSVSFGSGKVVAVRLQTISHTDFNDTHFSNSLIIHEAKTKEKSQA